MARTLLWLTVTLIAAGCDGSDFGSPHLTHSGGGCGGGQDGVIVLAWTVHGAAPSATSCAGIDHLHLDLTGQACDVTIDPIPCTLDHWRYDNLPEGEQQATLTAVSAGGAVTATGVADVDLTPEVPPSPAPIDLE